MTDGGERLARVIPFPGAGPAVADAPTVDDADADAAYRAGIRLLARRDRSRREIERALGEIYDADAVAVTIERLEREGYVDDVALAQHLVGVLQDRKSLGRGAIAAELARRLLTPAAIEHALELIDAGDEVEMARRVAGKRAAQLAGLDREAAVRRLSSYLARRGYSGDAIRAAVEHALPGAARSR